MMKILDIIGQLQAVADKHGNLDLIIQLHQSHNMEDVSIGNDAMKISVEDDNDGSGLFCCFDVETSKANRPKTK